MIENLTHQFDRLKINALEVNQMSSATNRARSPTPVRNNINEQNRVFNNNAEPQNYRNNNDQPHIFFNSASNVPFCNFCSSQGHTEFNCRLKQQNYRPMQYNNYQNQPRSQNNANDRFRFQNNTNNRFYSPRFSNYTPRWQNEGMRSRWPQINYQGNSWNQTEQQSNNWPRQTRYNALN
jgi:hypothetical protein